MFKNTKQFFEYIKGKKIGVIGAGVSHLDLIALLVKKGGIVSVRDKNDVSTLESLKGLDIKFITGEGYLNDIYEDIIFRTPGLDFYCSEITIAIQNRVIVTSEMEVFFQICPCKTFAITGSDGKTTSTTLISEMLKKQGYTVHIGGNIGRALLPIIEDIQPNDVAVVELSSFQLMSMRCAPDISIVTNVTPNHLNVHKTMEEYIKAKKNIFLHQDGFSKTVLNQDNQITYDFRDEIRGRISTFSRKTRPDFGCYMDERGDIYISTGRDDVFVMNKDIIKVPGIHNVENYLTAITATYDLIDIDNIKYIAKNFGGVEHRIELVDIIDGVKWYNDSIASSPTRTIAGLKSFDQKLIILAGGYDKDLDFEPLAPVLCEHCKILILMGDTANKIKNCVENYSGYNSDTLPIIMVENMEEAVKKAYDYGVEGDIVSLSPACASFDSYPNFEVRGKHFKSLVGQLRK